MWSAPTLTISSSLQLGVSMTSSMSPYSLSRSQIRYLVANNPNLLPTTLRETRSTRSRGFSTPDWYAASWSISYDGRVMVRGQIRGNRAHISSTLRMRWRTFIAAFRMHRDQPLPQELGRSRSPFLLTLVDHRLHQDWVRNPFPRPSTSPSPPPPVPRPQGPPPLPRFPNQEAQHMMNQTILLDLQT